MTSPCAMCAEQNCSVRIHADSLFVELVVFLERVGKKKASTSRWWWGKNEMDTRRHGRTTVDHLLHGTVIDPAQEGT